MSLLQRLLTQLVPVQESTNNTHSAGFACPAIRTIVGADTSWSPNAHGADSVTSELSIEASGRFMYAGNRHQQGHTQVYYE